MRGRYRMTFVLIDRLRGVIPTATNASAVGFTMLIVTAIAARSDPAARPDVASARPVSAGTDLSISGSGIRGQWRRSRHLGVSRHFGVAGMLREIQHHSRAGGDGQPEGRLLKG
jgi:hypothetical protein